MRYFFRILADYRFIYHLVNNVAIHI